MKRLYTAVLAFTAMTMAAPSALNAQQPASLIHTDRVWEYIRADYGETEDTVTKCELFRYRFDGTTEEAGHTYTRLMLDETVSWTIEKDGFRLDTKVVDSPVTRKVGECAALLREEGGKVWMLHEDAPINCYNLDNEVVGTIAEGEEIPLYDFNVKAGDTTYALTRGDIFMGDGLHEAIVLSADMIEEPLLGSVKSVSITPYKGGTHPLWSYVEGIGNINEGDMTEYGFQSAMDCICGVEERFSCIYDLEGNVLYGENLVPSGTHTIQTPASADSPCYDLMGRQLSEPLPGTVYIRAGKKYVGR